MEEENLNILNTGEMTHFSAAYQSYSAIDITYGSLILQIFFDWSVLEDSMRSDHFAIAMSTFVGGSSDQSCRRWKIKETDWSKFQEKFSEAYTNPNSDDPIQDLTHAIQMAAEKSIPKS